MTIAIGRIKTFLFRAEVRAGQDVVRQHPTPQRAATAGRGHGRRARLGGRCDATFPPFSADNKIRLFKTVIAPVALAGRFEDAADAWHGLTARTARWAVQGGKPGPFAACIAGLDLALWDLAARRAGQPIPTRRQKRWRAAATRVWGVR